MKRAVLAAVVAASAFTPVFAQDKKAEEEPFWAVGRPKASDTALKITPVPAHPIPTARVCCSTHSRRWGTFR